MRERHRESADFLERLPSLPGAPGFPVVVSGRAEGGFELESSEWTVRDAAAEAVVWLTQCKPWRKATCRQTRPFRVGGVEVDAQLHPAMIHSGRLTTLFNVRNVRTGLRVSHHEVSGELYCVGIIGDDGRLR